MVCIHCGSKTAVSNSRAQRRSNQVWRRRRCLNPSCGLEFTTEERASLEKLWLVDYPKGSGHSANYFSSERLWLSLYKCLGHRDNALEAASGLRDTIISRLAPFASNGHLGAQEIADVSLVALKRFDKLAAANYAAYHQTRS